MADKVRLGIIGLGTQGGFYASFLLKGQVPRLEVTAICDNDPAKEAVAAELAPGVPFFADYRDLLDSGLVDAVVTTVPHYLHAEMGIAAIGKGIHALVEKPAGVYTKQVRELNEFAAQHPETTFAIVFNQRTNELYIDIKKLMESGELGKLRRWNWIITNWWRPQGYYNQSDWRATWGGEGGGVLVNQAPHQIDLSQWLCGMPKKVFAKLGFGTHRAIAVEDEVVAVYDYGDGVTGSFTTCTHDIVGTDRLEILCDKGKIVVDNSKTVTITRLTKDEEEISNGITPEQVRSIFSGKSNLADFKSEETKAYDSVWGAQHVQVFANFTEHILDGAPLVAPGSDGINGVRLANAMHLSAFTGREVSIDFDEDEYLAELNKRIAEEGKFPQRT